MAESESERAPESSLHFFLDIYRCCCCCCLVTDRYYNCCCCGGERERCDALVAVVVVVAVVVAAAVAVPDKMDNGKNQPKSAKIRQNQLLVIALECCCGGQTLIAGRSLGNDVGLKPGAT